MVTARTVQLSFQQVGLGLPAQLGLPRILHRTPGRQRDLALTALIARFIHHASKLATARGLSPDTADSSLGVLLDLGLVSGSEMLARLDWLRPRQPWIERSPAYRHLQSATLIFYDLTSTYLEGQRGSLAAQIAKIRDRFRVGRCSDGSKSTASRVLP